MRLFKSRRALGLDIGSSSVKLVELEASGQGYRLTRFGFSPLPPEAIVQGAFMNTAAISTAIREACDRSRLQARNVATSVSGHSVIVKKLTLPAQSPEELEATIHWEAEQHIPFDINEVNVDYQVIQDSATDGQMDLILVAAKKELIDGYQGVICDAGLNLSVLDVDAFAIGNMYEHNYQPSSESTVALINIGASVVNISVMNGAVPVFTRDLTTGGNSYTESIQKDLNLSFEEAERIKLGDAPGDDSKGIVPREVEDCMRAVSEILLGEILRSIDFYRATASNRPIQRALLCGGASRSPGLERMLEEQAGFPVGIANPFERIDVSDGAADRETIVNIAPALSVAVGLAMRGVNES